MGGYRGLQQILHVTLNCPSVGDLINIVNRILWLIFKVDGDMNLSHVHL